MSVLDPIRSLSKRKEIKKDERINIIINLLNRQGAIKKKELQKKLNFSTKEKLDDFLLALELPIEDDFVIIDEWVVLERDTFYYREKKAIEHCEKLISRKLLTKKLTQTSNYFLVLSFIALLGLVTGSMVYELGIEQDLIIASGLLMVCSALILLSKSRQEQDESKIGEILEGELLSYKTETGENFGKDREERLNVLINNAREITGTDKEVIAQ
ncbi:MAG: hypothetical protein ACTSYA_08140 [Candidatus Kariarchaeaceae archaeon]